MDIKLNIPKIKWVWPMSILGLGICTLLSLSLGVRIIPFKNIVELLIFKPEIGLDQLVLQARLVRTLFGLLAGMALGVSGALMQAITRNPIADPSILGVNTGAALSVVIGISFFSIGTPSQYIIFAIVGAGLTATFVYRIGSIGAGGATPIKLALAGAATSAALSSAISAILLPRAEVMNAFRFWQVGSISGASIDSIIAIVPFLMMGLLVAFGIAPSLDILALGDEMASGLGLQSKKIRMLGALAGVVLCGVTTALAGPIGFVGLIVPHIVRTTVGSSLKKILPLSAVYGACLLLLSDVLGRMLGGVGELEAGIVTAFIGAPILIIIAMKTKVKSL